jgi:hypothetical protein
MTAAARRAPGPSQKTRDKAARLWADGRVTVDIAEPDGPSNGPTYLALVRGESNCYAAVCGPPDGTWRCPCQSYVVCSHLMACWIGLAETVPLPQWEAVWAPTVAGRLREDHPEITATYPDPTQEA